ncbi:hypothetical protein PanWU01x14_029020 [Parasponia andersonii]|uniref:Uncharacterized protein n=1 Tax=Parasponia andersonii TaxID=3476 RepID=A0A2P5DVG1_PARAD|nr:hypothetical protein PanWU01x14_029020 [Parasponia andersonii]
MSMSLSSSSPVAVTAFMSSVSGMSMFLSH